MNKKVRFLLALAMSLTMGVSATACEAVETVKDWLNIETNEDPETPPAGDEEGEEGGEVTPPAGGEEGGEVTPPAGGEGEEGGEVTPPASGEDDVTSKLSVTVATADELAAINATNITDYVNGTPVVIETAYTFTALETLEEVKAGEYANWWADYYVSVDQAVGEGEIGLAGSYDAWQNGAWVAFYAPAVEANQEIGLLKTASGGEENKYWTYAEVVEFVGTFRCGAFDLNNACSGKTLKVELRLTNPEDATDFVSVNVTTYTFA